MALEEGNNGVVFDGQNNIPIDKIAPDLVGYKEIPPHNLILGQKLGQVGPVAMLVLVIGKPT